MSDDSEITLGEALKVLEPDTRSELLASFLLMVKEARHPEDAAARFKDAMSTLREQDSFPALDAVHGEIWRTGWLTTQAVDRAFGWQQGVADGLCDQLREIPVADFETCVSACNRTAINRDLGDLGVRLDGARSKPAELLRAAAQAKRDATRAGAQAIEAQQEYDGFRWPQTAKDLVIGGLVGGAIVAPAAGIAGIICMLGPTPGAWAAGAATVAAAVGFAKMTMAKRPLRNAAERAAADARQADRVADRARGALLSDDRRIVAPPPSGRSRAGRHA